MAYGAINKGRSQLKGVCQMRTHAEGGVEKEVKICGRPLWIPLWSATLTLSILIARRCLAHARATHYI